jgi:hypothetical protein
MQNIGKNIYLLDPLTDSRWDEFVEKHPYGWITHQSGWKKVIEQSFKHIKGHYIVLIDEGSGSIQAGLPLFEVKSWITGNRMVSIPFATLADPLVSSSEQFSQIFNAALELLKSLRIPKMEIRTLKSNSYIHNKNLIKDSENDLPYLLLDKDLEEIRKSFHKTSVRDKINKAIKHNLQLVVADSEDDLRKFYNLYIHTRKSLLLPPQPYAYFQNLWKEFHRRDNMDVILAKFDNRIIAGVVNFKFKDRVSGEFESWDRHYRDHSPVHFVIWESIKKAHREGYTVFDMGRTLRSSISLLKFKERWGTKVDTLPKYFYQNGALPSLEKNEDSFIFRVIQQTSKILPTTLFPQFGRFIYKHMG